MRDSRQGLVALATGMAGVAAICLALGNDLVAVLVLGLMAGAIPLLLFAALRIAPAPPKDLRVKPVSASLLLMLLILFLVLAWAFLRAPWIPAGGTRQLGIEWIGSRFLSDDIILLVLLPALLALAATAVIALLRSRTAPRA